MSAFPEKIRLEVLKKADYRCCLCRSIMSVEIHHIIPKSEGGSDSFDNAAPLCASCHNMYGDNPIKKKTIREQRDNWYEIIEDWKKHPSYDVEYTKEIFDSLTKIDQEEKGIFNRLDNVVFELKTTLTAVTDEAFKDNPETRSAFHGLINSITLNSSGYIATAVVTASSSSPSLDND